MLEWVAAGRAAACRALCDLGAAVDALALEHRLELERTADSFLAPDEEDEDAERTDRREEDLLGIEASLDDLEPIGSFGRCAC